MSKWSQQTYDFIKNEEGVRYEPYADGTGDKAGWSIGYGHYTRLRPGESIPTNLRWTEEQAERVYRQDLDERYNYLSRTYDWFNNLDDNRKTAIMSYYYNRGVIPEALANAMSSGDWKAASDFLIAGNPEHLMARRQREARLIYDPDAATETEAETETESETETEEEPEQYMPPVPGSEESNQYMDYYNQMLANKDIKQNNSFGNVDYNVDAQRRKSWSQAILDDVMARSNEFYSQLSQLWQ